MRKVVATGYGRGSIRQKIVSFQGGDSTTQNWSGVSFPSGQAEKFLENSRKSISGKKWGNVQTVVFSSKAFLLCFCLENGMHCHTDSDKEQ